MPSNRSAFVDDKGKPLRVADSAMPKPGADDIVVRNYAVAINTIDPAQADGFQIRQYPTVLGHDLAGEVFDVGSNVTRFKKGGRVIGHARQFRFLQVSQKTEPSACIRAFLLAMQPSYLTACGFYEEGYMQLDLPSLDAKPNGKVVVVYGGSSSVGIAAIQLAVNAGYRVIATSSSNNFDLCREAGASDVFDYKVETVAGDIAKAVCDDKFVGLYNAIGIPESFDVVTPIMEKLNGGFLANTKPLGKLPNFIDAKFVLGVGDFGFPVWDNFITKALESGKLKCLPEAKVVGKGLESLQEAFEVRNGDVSAQKVVVEL
ncbi:hypothetical protein LTR37_019242 [Vermiconidia calcicola]|uniref:Uncharacterized protein n=1 Tax=Vermiconidia calcicola TaxID=1690605 RepID=A0ACC3MG91_9PEZI|nr:hypothetical protein LTR37_019242 [Vermiconidia calcicola]